MSERDGTVQIECRPSRAGNILLFPYTLRNRGREEVYAVHALPAADPANGVARANQTGAVVVADRTGNALIGKFAAPAPTERRFVVPMQPLVCRLPGGAAIEGRIEIPLPLAETSPYLPDLTLREYEIVELKGVIVAIGYWRAETTDLIVRPAEDAPKLMRLLTADPVRTATLASRHFPTHGLQLFKRTDAFPRSLRP